MDEFRSSCDGSGTSGLIVVKRRKTPVTHECALVKIDRPRSTSTNQRLKLIRRKLIVVILTWLFMNTDPAYPQRVIGSMIASRILRNSLVRSPFSSARAPFGGTQNGLNTVEAIALIHALNGNRGGGSGNGADLTSMLLGDPGINSRLASQSRQVATRQAEFLPTNTLERQAGPTVVVAAVAAFLAAVAAGLTPFQALAAAVAAAAAALLAVFAAIVALLPQKKKSKNSPIVKKLVIKKTVLPFVIPIPIPIKKKEVVYIPKMVHHKEHHHHKEYKYKKHKKYKKSDDQEDLAYLPTARTPILSDHSELGYLDKIDSVLSEQDRIQSMVDNVVNRKQPDKALA